MASSVQEEKTSAKTRRLFVINQLQRKSMWNEVLQHYDRTSTTNLDCEGHKKEAGGQARKLVLKKVHECR